MRRAAFLPFACLILFACAPPAPETAGNQAAAPPPPPAQPPSAETSLAGVTNLDVQYYDVSGNSLFEIRRALNRVRPRDPNDGLGVDALSSWYIAWRWPGNPDGGCDLSRAEIRFSASIRMPRLVETAATPAAVRTRWRAYAASLARHEANHVRHAWENRSRVLAAIRASTCADADRAARAAIAALARHDLDYDRRTRHGATEGAHFP